MNAIVSSILILAFLSVSPETIKASPPTTNPVSTAKTNSSIPANTNTPAADPVGKASPPASTNAPAEPANPTGSASLTSEAWQALERKDYATAQARIAKCRELYEAKALEMQAGLSALPPPDKAHSYWALNDVGTSLFILGKVTEAEGKPKEALEYYQVVVDRFPMAQCWDKQGWFWQPAVAAKERKAALTLESTE